MAENNIESILIGLVNAGIKKVRVYYEGSGDSGCIDSILNVQQILILLLMI